ncbi:hypothetical protein CEK28_08870 [Xenophilus sp. AP218F]|nr:hypothetical protein CEK28_08870 [Xenophilus sp. AP218F]
MSARDEVNQMLEEAVAKLHQTHDSIKPAVQMETQRRKFRFMSISAVRLNYILGLTLVIAVAGNVMGIWFAAHRVREYFAADRGRYMQLIPMSQPYRKSSDVLQFGKETLERSLMLDFVHWRQQLEDVRPRYTAKGYESVLKALNDSKLLDLVKSKQRMNLQANGGTAVLVGEAPVDGIYQWVIRMPIQVQAVGQTTEMAPMNFMATIEVERSTVLDNIEGVQLRRIELIPR